MAVFESGTSYYKETANQEGEYTKLAPRDFVIVQFDYGNTAVHTEEKS